MTRSAIRRLLVSQQTKNALLQWHATRSVRASKGKVHAVAMELAAQTGWVCRKGKSEGRMKDARTAALAVR